MWNHSTFSKNRDRLLEADIAKKLLAESLAHPKVRVLLSDEHFTVDGTMVQAWASMKSFQPNEPAAGDSAAPTPPAADRPAEPAAAAALPPAPDAGQKPEPAPTSRLPSGTTEATPEKPTTAATTAASPAMPTSATDMPKSRNDDVAFHGQKRSNATHASTTDPEARLYRKGKEAKLAYLGHALAENRHGLIVNADLTQATGTAERDAALPLVTAHSPGTKKVTLGGDKGYDTAGFVADCRAHNVTPHVAQNNKNRASAIDARTTRHPGDAQSQKKRKRIEEAFGWAKTIGGLARPMRRGIERMAYAFTFSMAAYDLVRLPKLLAAA